MNWSSYQERTYRTKPNYLTVYLINNLEFDSVVDLGCGSGNDTVYMLKRGKKVTAIDGSLKEEYILDRISEDDKKRLVMDSHSFEDVVIPKTDCIVSLFSLPFCEPSKFNSLWNKIDNALEKDGIIEANLFGERDYHIDDNRVSNHTKEQVLELLSGYEIIKWKEQEYTRELDNTHWHYYDFIAKKK